MSSQVCVTIDYIYVAITSEDNICGWFMLHQEDNFYEEGI